MLDEGQGHAAFAAALCGGSSAAPGVMNAAAGRFAVYRNNVAVGLVRALEANFPAVRRLLGETYFAGFARDFALAEPPTNPLIFFYGARFAEALAAAPDLAAFPYLPDVARLEQAWRESYHEQDATALDAARLHAIAPDRLHSVRLVPHPSLRLVSSIYAVHDIFTANRSDVPATVDDPMRSQHVLVTRPADIVLVTPVDTGTAALARSLADGQTLGDAAEQAFASDAEFNLAQAIATVLNTGAFSEIAGEAP